MLLQIGLILGLCLVLGCFELLFPAQATQKPSSRIRNLTLTAIYLVMASITTAIIASALRSQPRPLQDLGVVSSLIILFEYLFLQDLIFYWYHRLQHRSKWLWAVHELHHADEDLNATSSLRSYWLEAPLQTLIISVPLLYIVGIDPVATALLPFVATGWLYFTHANLRLELGPITPIVGGPQWHRLHHSDQPEHRDTNFAQFFPIIDMVFGTYRAPGKGEFPTTGTAKLRSDAPIRTVLAKPFKDIWSYLFQREQEKTTA